MRSTLLVYRKHIAVCRPLQQLGSILQVLLLRFECARGFLLPPSDKRIKPKMEWPPPSDKTETKNGSSEKRALFTLTQKTCFLDTINYKYSLIPLFSCLELLHGVCLQRA